MTIPSNPRIGENLPNKSKSLKICMWRGSILLEHCLTWEVGCLCANVDMKLMFTIGSTIALFVEVIQV